MKLSLTNENKLIDIPELLSFDIGDEVICDATDDFDRFEGVIIGIELRRVYGSDRLEPCITLLHDGYITDEFKPRDLRKKEASNAE
ncbi:hypothetical protein EDF68_10357 [Ochrobactrum sp. BH3]|nr:hypothetical protein EDF68_10357 [Ochrobactrum sp. BH3]